VPNPANSGTNLLRGDVSALTCEPLQNTRNAVFHQSTSLAKLALLQHSALHQSLAVARCNLKFAAINLDYPTMDKNRLLAWNERRQKVGCSACDWIYEKSHETPSLQESFREHLCAEYPIDPSDQEAC
jgi:hypothetical protein